MSSTGARDFLLTRVPSPLNILTRTAWTDQPMRPCRVYVADGVLRVFVASPAGGAKLELLEEVADVTVERIGRAFRITRPDGSVLEVAKAGCGCGSPLKNFNPARWVP